MATQVSEVRAIEVGVLPSDWKKSPWDSFADAASAPPVGATKRATVAEGSKTPVVVASAGRATPLPTAARKLARCWTWDRADSDEAEAIEETEAAEELAIRADDPEGPAIQREYDEAEARDECCEADEADEKLIQATAAERTWELTLATAEAVGAAMRELTSAATSAVTVPEAREMALILTLRSPATGTAVAEGMAEAAARLEGVKVASDTVAASAGADVG